MNLKGRMETRRAEDRTTNGRTQHIHDKTAKVKLHQPVFVWIRVPGIFFPHISNRVFQTFIKKKLKQHYKRYAVNIGFVFCSYVNIFVYYYER